MVRLAVRIDSAATCRRIIPQAPVRSFNCTKCGTGTGWYDVASFATLNDVDRFPFPSVSVPADCDSSALDLNEPRQTAAAQAGTALDEDLPGLIESARTVYALIRYELNRGVPASMIHLAGYSQGAALAIFVAATYPEPLAGVHAVAGYWPAREVLRCVRRRRSGAFLSEADGCDAARAWTLSNAVRATARYDRPMASVRLRSRSTALTRAPSYDLGNASATYMRELGYTNVHLITHAGLNHETVWWSPRVLPSWAIFLDQTLPRARTRSSDPDAPPWLSSLYG